jgi:transaldolase
MVDIFIDTASLDDLRIAVKNPLVKGATTNPTLMRASGVTNYEAFAREAIEIMNGLPISLEVFSDDFSQMEIQARKIASWGSNVNVKIPITNTKGESAAPLVRKLSDDGIVCNVTAVFTKEQVINIDAALNKETKAIISIFAGRIADTGRPPHSFMAHAVSYLWSRSCKDSNIQVLWASPREVLNIYQAEQCGCHIITVPLDLLKKYEQLKGKDLKEFSLSTVKMFYEDAAKAGYIL